MSQFEFTINGTTLRMTAEDVVKLEAAMLDATKSSTGQAFRQGSTGHIYAKRLSEQGSDAQRFSKHSSGIVETDC